VLSCDTVQPDLHQYVMAVWFATGIVWVVGAVRTKRNTRSQTAGSRLLHMGLGTAGFVLLFRPGLHFGPLRWQFVPDSAVIAYAGLALTIAGAAFAIWARVLLGRNWSASVTIKEDHQIMRRGPYSIVRHPIYSGGLLAMLGTSLAFGELGCLAGTGLVFITWWMKSRLEETFLEKQWGAEYAQYKREVKALIPFVL
jgi:protein-S-isoprenylcysteine O-methyltransferase Ste14